MSILKKHYKLSPKTAELIKKRLIENKNFKENYSQKNDNNCGDAGE